VFVLGLDRSGTTWLANLLANHPRAVAVQSHDHFGVHESIFFSHFARAYGDLRDDVCFQRFAADFTQCDYYLLTGIEPEWLVARRPRGYPEAFRAVMDEFAARQPEPARAWIEKSPAHTLIADALARDFPDARFVAIVRRHREVIASRLVVSGEPPPGYPGRVGRLLRLSRDCSLYERWLRRFCAGDDGRALLTYEALTADPASELARACEVIGLEFEPAMLDLPWRRNTSFEGKQARSRGLSLPDQIVTASALAAFGLIPAERLRAQVFARQRGHEIEWPSWVWRRRDTSDALV
jgi:hypothetical protein